MNSTGNNQNLKYINQVQLLADSIENVWSSISPEIRKNENLRIKYAKIKELKNQLQLKIQGELTNENTK